MERTKCARCGQRGHWARTCTNPPDERGKRRTGMITNTGFMIAESCEPQENASVFIAPIFAFPQAVETLIGMYVSTGFGLLDTGAQHGVIGLKDFNRLCERLAQQGLKPRSLPTFEATAVGVGGNTTFLQSAEMPVGIQGVSGVLVLHVIDTNLPLLLPISFWRNLGMILDTNDNTATWKKLGNRVSEVVTLPSEHIAIDILEFPPGGWQNPHQVADNGLFQREPDRKITRADFETTCTAALLKPSTPKALAGTTTRFNSSALCGQREDVQPSMSPSPKFGDTTTYRDVWQRGRGGKVVRVTEVVPLEIPLAESPTLVPGDLLPDQSKVALGNSGLQPNVPDQSDLPGPTTDPVSFCPRTGGGKLA